MYNRNKQVSIEEDMIPYKGRSSMKQYLLKKPVKRGFKIWMRGDSINGYISELEVYTGKQGDKVEVGFPNPTSTCLPVYTSSCSHLLNHPSSIF